MSTPLDLSQIAPPDALEVVDFEARLAVLKERLAASYDFTDVESEPLVALTELMAYADANLRARVNDGVRACMLATATGADLDNHGALFGVSRLVLSPGDSDAVPPVPPILEDDARLRRRIQLAPEGLTVAGPRQSYVFHALSFDGRILDVSVQRLDGGVVSVVYYAVEDGLQVVSIGDGLAAALGGEDVRPLTDTVAVAAADVVAWDVEAVLTVAAGPDAAVVEAEARAALEAFASAQAIIGRGVALSGVYAALHRSQVVSVDLVSPAADLVAGPTEVFALGAVTLSVVPE